MGRFGFFILSTRNGLCADAYTTVVFINYYAKQQYLFSFSLVRAYHYRAYAIRVQQPNLQLLLK